MNTLERFENRLRFLRKKAREQRKVDHLALSNENALAIDWIDELAMLQAAFDEWKGGEK